MFKKPLSHLKTSAPLRSSDRRKLRQRVVAAYSLTPEEGDALVPEGIMSVKFMTHVDAPGVAYLSPDGEPLWFTVGKSADDPLLPSVYTLWKKQDMLPFLSTPAAVVPILVGGADLMVPGGACVLSLSLSWSPSLPSYCVLHASSPVPAPHVFLYSHNHSRKPVVHATPGLSEGQLVCVRQYISKNPSQPNTTPALSPPVAVGRLALNSDLLRSARSSEDTNKGKAVHVVHTWKDHLWEMAGKSSKREMPPNTPLPTPAKPMDAEKEGVEDEEEDDDDDGSASSSPPTSSAMPPSPTPPPDNQVDAPASPAGVTYTPAEVSTLLELALVQAIAKSLADGANPKSLFPIPATKFYTDHILPCRPAFPTLVLPPSSSSSSPPLASAPTNAANDDNLNETRGDAPRVLTDLTIKSSSHKNLSAFLKAMEKAGLVSVKQPQKNQPDVLVTGVHADHARVAAHAGFATVADVERTEARRKARLEAQSAEGQGGGQGGSGGGGGGKGGGGMLTIRELYAPEGPMKEVFEAFGLSTDASPNQRYTAPEIKNALNAYITREGLVNAGDQAYINLDEVLLRAVSSSGSQQKKVKGQEGIEPEEQPRWLRRDELTKKVLGSKKLQAWHEIGARHQGAEPVLRKGTLLPISITSKTRAGRKVVTSIAGFEPFLSLPYSNAGNSSTTNSNRGTSAEEMADDLRKLCAGATTVGPTTGGFKLPGGGVSQTVTVQGKQGKAVLEYLLARGVPKEWVSVEK
ncbi:hypothetical protein D9619_008997 [Psilocybe cf. subviscida]|uniref:SUI1 domain-containing protein n=1 Tax=Psilocybe cf. subviscida TaxID=2480587 RepID=A0A8H5BTR9_9AGAR|nr:hypothetical protein D9619_008997 [Psilocybe cf. subviscida]